MKIQKQQEGKRITSIGAVGNMHPFQYYGTKVTHLTTSMKSVVIISAKLQDELFLILYSLLKSNPL